MQSLKAGESRTGGGLGKDLGLGLFGRKGTIKTAIQDTQKTLGSYKPDVFVQLEIDSGSQFDDRVDIFGSFWREKVSDTERGPIEDWGSVGKVDQLCVRFSAYDGLSDADKDINLAADPVLFPAAALNNLVGCKAYYVLMCVGKKSTEDKPQWSNYYYVVPCIEDTPEEADKAYKEILEALFGDDYAVNKQLNPGRDYLERKNGTASSPASSEGPVNTPLGNQTSDDLPF